MKRMFLPSSSRLQIFKCTHDTAGVFTLLFEFSVLNVNEVISETIFFACVNAPTALSERTLPGFRFRTGFFSCRKDRPLREDVVTWFDSLNYLSCLFGNFLKTMSADLISAQNVEGNLVFLFVYRSCCCFCHETHRW